MDFVNFTIASRSSFSAQAVYRMRFHTQHYVKEIFEVNHFKGFTAITITDSVESGLEALSCSLKAA